MFRATWRPSWMAAGARPGTSWPSRCTTAGRSPRRVDVGVPGQREVWLHLHPAGPVERHPQRPAERRGGDAGAPEHGPRRDALVADPDALLVDARHHRAGPDLDAERGEPAPAPTG